MASRTSAAFLLDQGWIVQSSASHAASVVFKFARNLDGTWRFCQDYRGITQRLVEPMQHVDQLGDETRGARFFTKIDLAMAYMQFCIREEDQFRTSFRVTCCQYEFRVSTFGLHGMASVLNVLMRFMHSIVGHAAWPFHPIGQVHSGIGGGSPMIGRFIPMTFSFSPRRARST